MTLTKHEFATNTADKVVKKSKHEAINKELQLINGQLEWAAHIVDDTEWLLGVKTRWQCGDAEYWKTLEYISNREFVRVVEKLQGLIMSRLMEMDKVNLAGSVCSLFLCDVPNASNRL